jgi:hypothetical protein
VADQTGIANLAATRIGTASRITSLDDDRTVARALKAVWDIERQATLRDGSFNFATVTDALPAIAASDLPSGVPYPWSVAYQLPSPCLRLVAVLSVSARSDYELQGRRILCDAEAPLQVRYVADVPELALWDAEAAAAFALRLAWRCGHKIAGSAFDHDACWAEYRAAIAAAKSTDAQENPPISTEGEDDSWVSARYGAWR